MSDKEDNLRLVHSQSDVEIKRETAQREVTYYTIKLLANMMRVLRGAEKPHEIVHDAAQLVLASEQFRELKGFYPANQIGADLSSDFSFRSASSDWNEGIDIMVSGALQIAASRLLGQRTQERAGEKELIDGLRIIEEIRAKNRVRRGF